MRPESGTRGPIACFGVFEVDLERGALRREGRSVPLQQHQFLILTALVESSGKEVSREALRRSLWPDQQFLDFENGINTAVARLRQSLGDSAENPRFIATRRGHGYRLLLPVTWVRPAGDSGDHQGATPAALPEPPARAATAPWPGSVRSRFFGLTIGIVALLGASFVLSWNRAVSHPPDQRAVSSAARTDFSVYPPPGAALTGSFALSPDGRWLAFVAAPATFEQSRIWLRSLDGVAARPLAGTENAAMPFWSPDGGSLGFFADGRLKTIDLRNGQTTTLARAPRGRGGAWSADGVILFAPDVDSGILSIPASGGAPSLATDVAGAPSHRFPCYLPDGRHFLFLVLRDDRDESEIHWGRLGGPETGRLLTASSNAVYTKPGYLIFARGAALLAQRFDAGGLRTIAPPIVVSERVGVYGEAGPTGLGAFSVSADGTLATTDILRPALRFSWFDRHGRRIGTVGPPGDYEDFDLAPDAAHIAVARYDSRKRSSDVMTMDLRSGVQTQITDDPWPDGALAWAPGDNRLAFTSLRAGTWTAVVRDVALDGRERQVGACGDFDAWFPDGAHVLCGRAAEKGRSLWKLPADGRGAPVSIVDGVSPVAGARVSPDGRWLAYSPEQAARQREVWVVGLRKEALPRAVSLGPGTTPHWRRDARELFFLSGQRLVAVPVETRSQTPFGVPVPLFDAPLPARDSLADFPPQFAVSPDGSRFLFAIPTESSPRLAIHVVPNWTAARPAEHSW